MRYMLCGLAIALALAPSAIGQVKPYAPTVNSPFENPDFNELFGNRDFGGGLYNDFGGGGFGGNALPAKEVCKIQCDADYQYAARMCSTMHDAANAAVCHQNAAAYYSRCLRACG
jgi:hypothetical protein